MRRNKTRKNLYMRRPATRLGSMSLAMVLALIIGCAANQGCRETPQGPPRVIIQATNGKEVAVDVELARRPSEQSRGLMYRQHLDPDSGMLFVYMIEGKHSFYMKNTYIPLDMIFIGSNMRVVGIARNTKPLSTKHIGGEITSQYILEVNAGFCERQSIEEGAVVRFEGFNPD